MDIPKVRAVLLDLDGVLYRGSRLCRGAKDFVAAARQMGIRPFFLSNNSRSGADTVARKLTDLEVPATSDEVITAAELLIEYMARRPDKGSVAVIGSDWLCDRLRMAGWRFDQEHPDYLAVGLDHQFSYAKLCIGVDALQAGAQFVAANFDPVNPIEGRLEPGCGSIIAALRAATGRRALCIGKPSVLILKKALDRLNMRADETLVVGDSLVSDMRLARRGGAHFALVLSGQTSPAMVERLPLAQRPGIVAADLAELHRLMSI